MPATSTTYTGINRTVSDFLPSGACEELVNLRPTDTGLRPVNLHHTLMTGVDFTHFWTHRIGTRICRIVRVPISSGSLYEYRWIDDEGQILQTLITVPSDADDHFAILVDADGGFLALRNTEDYTEDEAKEIMTGILETGKQQGMYGWLQYYVEPKSYGTLIVITDKTSDQGLLNGLFRTTFIIGVLMLLVLLTILIFSSRWITLPVQQAFKRQKQFVSDAGHELKTPIAVLTANADILKDEIGENKWLGYMDEQIGRMNTLVGDLLRLARMDNATQEYTFADFDLSMAVAATTLPFESAAFEQHRTLEMDVQPNVTYNGSEQHIRQLCAIFIDNAIKYSNENGLIKVTLMKRGEHCILEFYNTGCEIGPSETEKIFERFYRGDKARNKGKNGYGLGLAIAKSIMDVHKIRIQVTCEQGKWIRFLLTM